MFRWENEVQPPSFSLRSFQGTQPAAKTPRNSRGAFSLTPGSVVSSSLRRCDSRAARRVMEATSLPLFSSGASSPAVTCLSGAMRPPLWGHPLVRRLFGYLALAASSVTTVWPALAPTSPAVTSLCPSSLDDALRGVTPTRWGVPCWALTLQAHTRPAPRPLLPPRSPFAVASGCRFPPPGNRSPAPRDGRSPARRARAPFPSWSTCKQSRPLLPREEVTE